jgi:hypothetical protein
MKSKELLSKYPLTAKVVKDWFLNIMMESMNTDEIPEEFKQFILDEGISDDRISIVLDTQPRNLFDVFDEHEVFIEILLYPDNTFTCKIGNQATTNSWKKRKEAEAFAVEAAFEILENKLTSLKLNETSNQTEL